MSESKACTACSETKPLGEFYWTRRRNGQKARHSKCQACRRQQFKAWARTEHGKRSKRNGVMRREYGLAPAQYASMVAAQRGRCAICMRAETKRHRDGLLCQLSVDHDHTTGAVRGLLCSACNVGLGSFGDSSHFLRSAALYLERQIGQAKRHEPEITKAA